MNTSHPRLPPLSPLDLRVRRTPEGWRVEDAGGRPICETLSSIAEARLIGRTLVASRGRVWVARADGWALLDED